MALGSMSASMSVMWEVGVDFIPLPLQGAWIPVAWMLQTHRRGGFHGENYADTAMRVILGTTLPNHVQRHGGGICNQETG